MKTRYLEIDERTESLKKQMQLSDSRAREFQGKFDMSLIYHENALEGIVFTSGEILAALDPLALPADAAQVPVFAEIRNHRAAIDFIRNEARDPKARISVDMIKRLYELLGAGFEGRESAIFRKEMPLHRTYFHDIAQPAKIPTLLDELVELMNAPEFRELHPVEQAATVQWHFMQIFPFTENCGKVGRLLTQFLLTRDGYLPVIIHASDRQRYYESLRMPVTGLRSLVLEAMENSLENALKFFGPPPTIITVRPPAPILPPMPAAPAKPAGKAKKAASAKAPAKVADEKPVAEKPAKPIAAEKPVKPTAVDAKSVAAEKPAKPVAGKPAKAVEKPAAAHVKPAAHATPAAKAHAEKPAAVHAKPKAHAEKPAEPHAHKHAAKKPAPKPAKAPTAKPAKATKPAPKKPAVKKAAKPAKAAKPHAKAKPAAARAAHAPRRAHG